MSYDDKKEVELFLLKHGINPSSKKGQRLMKSLAIEERRKHGGARKNVGRPIKWPGSLPVPPGGFYDDEARTGWRDMQLARYMAPLVYWKKLSVRQAIATVAAMPEFSDCSHETLRRWWKRMMVEGVPIVTDEEI